MSKTNSTQQQRSNVPTHGVVVVEGEGESAFCTKIGAAWNHSDGKGFNITLSAIPLNGRLVLREKSEKEEGR